MTKTIALVLIIALRLAYQPAKANKSVVHFAIRQSIAATAKPAHTRLIGTSAIKINNNIILKWFFGENKSAWCFVVEKSNGGNRFSLAALVLETDKTGTDIDRLSLKAGHQRGMKRIKYTGKDYTTAYSLVTTIHPNT